MDRRKTSNFTNSAALIVGASALAGGLYYLYKELTNNEAHTPEIQKTYGAPPSTSRETRRPQSKEIKCAICNEDIDNDETVTLLSCNCKIHKKCHDVLKETDTNMDNCPSCRHVVDIKME